jgi:hypothetical protein
MRLLKPLSRTGQPVGATVRSFCWVMALAFTLAPQARASFINYYDLSNFVQSSTSDGFAFTPDAGLSVVIQGGNDGSGLAGTTDLVISAPVSGTVVFNYVYNSLDLPALDTAG